VYWRAYFIDDKSELAAEMDELFDDYIVNTVADINALEGFPSCSNQMP
jgi:hypothetical protein